MKSSIQNDFERERDILTSLRKVKTDFHHLILKTIGECSSASTGNFMATLKENPIFKAFNMLVDVNGLWKIDQQVAFGSVSHDNIPEALQFIEKEVLKRKLNVDDFHRLPSVIRGDPNLLIVNFNRDNSCK